MAWRSNEQIITNSYKQLILIQQINAKYFTPQQRQEATETILLVRVRE